MRHLDTIIDKVYQGERIRIDEGVVLFEEADLLTLAGMAEERRFGSAPG